MDQDQQNYYWLFSSSAQAISAFVAFLITGYALVINVMDGLATKDDTLEDIHHQLKLNYYRRIIWLVILTGAAIIFSLWMVYLNGGKSHCKPFLYGLTIVLNISVVILGISFVIAIINPDKYKRVAHEIIKEDKKDFPSSGSQVDQLLFMKEFIDLEKKIRDVLLKRELYVPSGNITKMAYSFRQMIQALYQNELINRDELAQLLRINKYRNLVFHGHEERVDKGMFDLVKTAVTVIDRIKP